VGKATRKSAPASVEIGWTELPEGRWQAARAVFAEAVAAEPTPEALEGLSWAAWWLDEPGAVFEARERAYRLYKDDEEKQGGPREPGERLAVEA
jgi:LuxR family transcriptional regulator, maltose regulon positive regulatory protein